MQMIRWFSMSELEHVLLVDDDRNTGTRWDNVHFPYQPRAHRKHILFSFHQKLLQLGVISGICYRKRDKQMAQLISQ